MFHKNKKGFSLVEVVVALSVAVFFFLAIYELILFANRATLFGIHRVEAMQVAKEGMEAVRTIRDAGWTDNISTLDGVYYLQLSGDHWILTTTAQPAINDLYTRTVTITAVNRDGNDDIVSVAGTADPNTKQVAVNVSWNERDSAKNMTLNAYMANILSN